MKKEIMLFGLDCAHCSEVINQKINDLEEVKSANLNFINKKLIIEIDENIDYVVLCQKIKKIIDLTEPGLNIVFEEEDTPQVEIFQNKNDLIKVLIGGLFYLVGIFQEESLFSNLIFLSVYLFIGFDVLKKSLKNILNGQIFDENFLMSIATLGAILIDEIPEAVGVMFFYKLGEYLQKVAIGKSRKSIGELMDIRPDTANLVKNSNVEIIHPKEVKVGDIILVKNGEKVPLDGIVIDGTSMVDTLALTGESVPRNIKKDDEILSGFINKGASLTIKVTKEYKDSTVSKILDLIENASSKKSKTENFITKFSRYYTPSVVLISLLITVIPPLFGEVSFSSSFYKGLVFLVVSCPCALVLSIPLGFFSGIGFASKNGILVKGSNYLEILKDVDTVVFDKTGTLTEGVFEVVKINNIGISKEDLIEFASFAEVNSTHPIAKSILKKYDKKINLKNILSYEEVASHGVKVNYNGNYILAGNDKLMKSENIIFTKEKESGTVIYISVNGVYRGNIIISDKIKKDSFLAIKKLREIGIKNLIMLSGDNQSVACDVSNKLNLDKFYANLLPNDKVYKLEEIIKENKKVIFVGDGINDAPVLARADIGISMGSIGSDASIEASDIVIMNDEISKIVKGIEISKKTNKIVYQNIVFALGVKFVVMILGAGGVASMWEAIFADVGVAILSVFNSMRILKD